MHGLITGKDEPDGDVSDEDGWFYCFVELPLAWFLMFSVAAADLAVKEVLKC